MSVGSHKNFPARRLRTASNEPWHMYGTTFRWYDPAIDAWHITWFDPSRPLEMRQIGRAVGADIVQVGEDANGLLSRWRFVEITDQSSDGSAKCPGTRGPPGS